MTLEELYQNLSDELDEAKNKLEEKRNECECFCQDKSNDLELRWKLFCYQDLGYTSSEIFHFSNSEVDKMLRESLEPGIVGRGAEINLVDFLSDLKEYNHISNTLYDECREELLSECIKSFLLDW